ncbi:MAG: selenide, water dikinase SelD [Bryobacterales bacterium]
MQNMAEMSSPGPLLTDDEARATLAAAKMRCAGCGGKIGAGPLERALAKIEPLEREGVVVGLRGADDAAAITVPCGKVAVQSVDFFRAFCDDPYLFGRITANHALGDIFAKGAEAHSALAIAVAPYARESKVEEALHHMLYGANEALREAGAALVGGHSSEGADLSLGLSVTGIADPNRLMRKGGARPGDTLVLTKPIGVGALFAADMMGQATGRWITSAMESMCRSNAAAAQVFLAHGATACTDVTGFGLAGHLAEMLGASNAAAEIELGAIPLLDGAVEVTLAGHRSSLYPQNVRVEALIEGGPHGEPAYPLLFDPQTAGGLLATVPPHALDETLAALERAGCEPAVIGRVTPAKDGEARIRVQS